jgi:CheY-like chemotaxis protein
MRKRVLLLEDNKEILELIDDILTGEGYQVIALSHYESVVDIIDFAPDLILLDIRLSNGYGHLLCRDLKADPEIKHIPVILVSAATNLEKIAKDSQADDFLSKPFDLQELIDLVKKYI